MSSNRNPYEIFLEPATKIKGISAKRSESLERLEIETVGDLAFHFPRRYEDWTKIKSIIDLEAEDDGVFLGRVETVPNLFRKGKRSILNVTVRDDTAVMKIVWFNQPYYQDKLIKGKIYLFRGKIKRQGLRFETANPKFVATSLNSFPKNEEEWQEVSAKSFVSPVYPATEGISQTYLRKWINSAVDLVLPVMDEYLSPKVRKEYDLADLIWSVKQIHNLDQEENYDIARRRLAFDELLFLQINNLMGKAEGARKPGVPIPLAGNSDKLQFWGDAVENLSFDLTNAQKQALNEIIKDMSKPTAMNRLLQGDVGSGKTIVAFLAMLWADLNQKQSVLMAPTSILAKQHYASFIKFFPDIEESRVALLTGDTTAKERQDIYENISNGTIKYLIGTHAVIEDKVKFKDLALAVTDEQHRFGVKQRVQLSDGSSAHVLVMSATPIPRTLGMLFYGDLDISSLKEKPAGRQPIKTYTARNKDKDRLLDLLSRNAAKGGQAYVVCPTVDPSEKLELASVTTTYEELKKKLPHLSVGLIHGQMKEAEKNEIMQQFLNGEINILVATTVIEVGVDNPNATMMIIVNAERFGLAALHQLRGRIGRGSKESLCVLLSDVGDGTSRERLTTLCRTEDGFEIAEADFKLRGPGDFFGTRQHGIPNFKIANLYDDNELLQLTGKIAGGIIKDDPKLEKTENQELNKIMNIYRRRMQNA
ncbi:ATP-dependent DNA helicase RecG [Fastidiosipila sanguinis]|uniref:ATP-dependent DNA helicase RecG n=1 Tax=Fastidiosipila sanguinis TaxID=236753 RepID=A0A2S0KNS2_9FIRM|nr:ATP-dependent DNA helicase RecG [Fastidiosipila sanguinis]AVM42685.1 DNA helicase RecG [Fastidiosipila sanguinis]